MTTTPYISLKNVSITYPKNVIGIKNISINIPKNSITAIIGSSNSGKTTLLRSFNLMHEIYPNIKKEGEIFWEGKDIFKTDIMEVRKKIGMIFQNPIPFPNMNVYENVLAGYTLNRIRLTKEQKDSIVEEALRDVGLWEKVKDVLQNDPATLPTKGQQQRVCIARTIALKPDILLMDDPTTSLDNPTCVNGIENLILKLKENHTIIMTVSSLSQAARLSDYIMYMEGGELIEYDTTSNILAKPKSKKTEKYITELTE